MEWPLVTGGFISRSSPALSPNGDTVYVGVELSNGNVAALIAVRTDTATDRWAGRTVRKPGLVTAAPVVSESGDTIYFAATATLYAINASNGTDRWPRPVELNGFIFSAPAIGADGTIYVGTAGVENALHAISPNGTRLWSYILPDRNAGVVSSPAIGVDGTIYFGARDGLVRAVSPAGELKWTFPADRSVGPISSSPAIARDGTIYVGSEDQQLYAITPEGQWKWSFLTNGSIYGSPALGADGTIYFAAADQRFYALRPDGTEQWRVPLVQTNSVSTPAVRSDGTILLGSDNGLLRSYRPDGSLARTFNTSAGEDEPMESSPIVGPDGSVYIGYDRLYKLRGSGARLSTASAWPALGRDTGRRGRQTEAATLGTLVNISTRAAVNANDTLIVGFVVDAPPEKRRLHLLRVVGPTLGQFGVSGAMPNPRVQLFAGSVPWASGGNDDWEAQEPGANFPSAIADTAQAVGAFDLPRGSRDAAVLPLLPGGGYSALATSADGRGGVALVELYDAFVPDPARLVNLSTRHHVGTGENVLISGFVVGGTQRTRLLLRAVGPGLAQFEGVPGVLARPVLQLFAQGAQTSLAQNERWDSGGIGYDMARVFESVAAFPLAPGSGDSAMVVTVEPGAYTLQVSGAGGTTGEALAEIYVLP